MKKIAILVSGKGTSMRHILQSITDGVLHEKIKVNLVIADRDCEAIQYALKENITTFSLANTKNLSKEIDNLLLKDIPDLIVLSGFISILDAEFCKKWEGRIINIHPSLLPKYGGKGMYGMRVHQKVLKNKEKISGATIHYVTKDIDSGNIILRKSCRISSQETPISLYKKISLIEKEILIQYLTYFIGLN
ncbi:MAG: phosphoribosylglycinamide formyltransferase [Flavobacteriales bacterium]|jgi:phosphoribosylglycinamide formyltransferase-1|uniref:formyltransferase family protein n=1 Tax=Blattabacterium sp. (Mastotermes darwiniensis) TaxID=39768 RepID=UPI000231DDD4|nr:formyltransferase family protein [Blattabacterium sp. (Mastotermes darwiniensis)]AER40520.1 phosphoribosylglycinamide formyltransferase [Blattabacterium sp. (Mastotermes darwiniensis) str. MADAR]MDR1804965.1 phosphoribosylglycinamide formyltransferase [Flavobacteriales bacterium]